LGRVLNFESAGRARTKTTKAIVKAMRELMLQQEANQKTKDLAAFIAIGLAEIHESVDVSVSAWEKRGYWVKADRFRLEWEWSKQFSDELVTHLLRNDWQQIAIIIAKTAQKLNHIQISANNRIGEPWLGAFDKLMNK
jgi:hypothetical protein